MFNQKTTKTRAPDAVAAVNDPTARGFLDLLACEPLIDQDEIAALVRLVEDFDAVYQHTNDRSGLANAQQAEKAAQAEIDRLVALFEIGRASQQEVQIARDLHGIARAALDSYPRRQVALANELRRLRTAVDDAAKPLATGLADWQSQFEPLAESMTETAIILLFLAAAADHHAGNYPFVPTERRELLSWLSGSQHFAAAYGHGETKPPAVPSVVIDVRRALAGAKQTHSVLVPEPAIAEEAPHHLHSYTTTPHADHVYDENVAQVVADWGR